MLVRYFWDAVRCFIASDDPDFADEFSRLCREHGAPDRIRVGSRCIAHVAEYANPVDVEQAGYQPIAEENRT